MEAQVYTPIYRFICHYKWCFTAEIGNVRNLHVYEEVGPALPPSGVGGEDQIEMEQNEAYGVSATDQVNTGNRALTTFDKSIRLFLALLAL